MKVTKRLLLPSVLSVTALLSACATVSPGYKPDVANQAALSKVHANNVAVGAFEQPAEISTMCRGNGPVDPPEGMTFASFVQDSLAKELKASGKLASGAPDVTLTGQLTKVDFSSSHHVVDGYWDLNLDLHSSNGKALSVAEHYEFGTSFLATIACNKTAAALPVAVEKLIHKVVTNPGFPALLAKN